MTVYKFVEIYNPQIQESQQNTAQRASEMAHRLKTFTTMTNNLSLITKALTVGQGTTTARGPHLPMSTTVCLCLLPNCIPKNKQMETVCLKTYLLIGFLFIVSLKSQTSSSCQAANSQALSHVLLPGILGDVWGFPKRAGYQILILQPVMTFRNHRQLTVQLSSFVRKNV